MDPAKFFRELRKHPKLVLNRAKYAKTKIDMFDLANWWQEEGLRLMSLGILDSFFVHLNPDKIPPRADPSTRCGPIVDKAFLALLGLTKSADFLRDPSPYSDAIINAWPGIYKWSVYFYTTDIQRRDADSRTKRTAQDLIAATWYSMTRVDRITPIIAATKGAVELMTQIFILEDSGPPSIIDIPSASATLDAIIREAEDVGDVLDRIVSAANRKAENIVQLAMSRIRTIMNGPHLAVPSAVITIDLIGNLSRKRGHPLRFAFLHHGVIPMMTKLAGNSARLLSKGGPSSLEAIMVSCFGYLANCMESTDGFTWVTSAIQAGLLQALVDASILLEKLVHPEDRTMIIALLKVVLPKYLAYRSVIQAVDGAMQKVDASSTGRLIVNTPAKEAWLRFKGLASARMNFVKIIVAVKGNLIMTCDNAHCLKVDRKNNFKKCASCSTSLYCSKECQTIAWKEGHRTMCKLKVQERLEGKNQSISKVDAAFFHSLTIEDIGDHIPMFKELAEMQFPGVPMEDLVACADYDAEEPSYHLELLEGYDDRQPKTGGTNNAIARNEALIKRVQDNPGKFCLFQSNIANGEGTQLVLTMVGGDFWSSRDSCGDLSQIEWDDCEECRAHHSHRPHLITDGTDEGESEDSIHQTGIDMARTTLNEILQKMGEPPAF